MHTTLSFEDLLQQEIGSRSLVIEHHALSQEIIPLSILRYVPGNRLVLRAKWQNNIIAVKLFFHRYKKYWHWQRECHGLQRLQEADIKTPMIVYKGTNHTKTAYLIATTYIENAHHFDDMLPPPDTTLPFLKAHIAIMVKLHKKNYVQHDWHVNNFLYTPDFIYAIDAGQIKPLRWQKNKVRFNNLALFLSNLPDGYQLFYRALYDAYCKDFSLPGSLSYAFVLQCIAAHKKRRLEKLQTKVFRASTLTLYKKTFFMRLLRTIKTRTPEWSDVLAHPNKLFTPEAIYLKKGNSSTVIKCSIDNKDYVIKRYNIKNAWHAVLRFIQPTRAAVNWRFSHVLNALSIPTPEPYAMVEHRFGCLRRTSFFISLWQAGVPLETYLPYATPAQQQLIAQQVITIFNQLREAQIIHGDTKASNWLVHNDKVYLLDLDGMTYYKTPVFFMRARQKELSRFLKNWNDEKIRHLFSDLIS